LVYEITAAADTEIRRKAAERQANKDAHQIQSKRFDPRRSDLEIHIEGMRAEYACSQVLNANLEWAITLGGDNNTGDLTLIDGRSVSVKFRRVKGWDFALQSSSPNEFKEDIGILTYPSPTHFRAIKIHGWATRDEFLNNYHIANYGYGDRAALAPDYFKPIYELIKELKYTNASVL